jgi:hypothetical protein
MKSTLATVALAAALAAAPGCIGSFGAFHRVQAWNGHATDNRVGNSIIHFVLWVVPVYETIVIGDLLIFNTIEFATGSNPMR